MGQPEPGRVRGDPLRGQLAHCATAGSHWPFENWGRFLPEHTAAVSLRDRLLHHCHTVVTNGDSYRMRQARTKGAAATKKT